MGIFSNESEGVGTRLFEKPPAPAPGVVPSGYEAFGHPVPFYRRAAADAHLKSMGVTDTETRVTCVGRMAECVERDDPNGALEAGYKVVDVTGCYRLLSVLCTAEEQA